MAEKLRLQEQRDAPGPAWEFVHPRCARKRRDDIEEVEAMVAAGEAEIARDELVWLLSECPDFLEAHLHLGLIALEDDDPKLARGHFGRAVELGFKALETAGNPRPLPYSLPGNRPFFESAKGLVHALLESGRKGMAVDTAKKIAALDPADPLGLIRLAAGGEGEKT
jgi:tetratricopeptide (TPR) repeat protein